MRRFNVKTGFIFFLVLSLMFNGMSIGASATSEANAASATIIEYVGEPTRVTGATPVGGHTFDDGNTFAADSNWRKWDIHSRIGEAIRRGASYRFTVSPAPDCDPNNLFVYAKAGRNMFGANVSPGETVLIPTVNFRVYFESATSTAWSFVVTGAGARHGLSNWGFLCLPVQPGPPAPEISLTKTGPPTAGVGETIYYSFTVTNTGNVLLTGVVVSDPLLELEEIIGELHVNDYETFTVAYTIPNDAAGSITNTATATGLYVEVLVTATASHVVTISQEFVAMPEISLTKTGPPTAGVGETIYYSFTVTNTGNVLLTGVVVSDPLLELEEIIGELHVNDYETFTVAYTIPNDAAGSITNTATATGLYVEVLVTATASHVVTIPIIPIIPLGFVDNPAITLTKTGPATAGVGATIYYSFTVTNTGNVGLLNVVVTDPLLGLSHNIGLLSIGQSVTFSAPYTIPAGAAGTNVINTATATGTHNLATVRSTSSHTLIVPADTVVVVAPEDPAVVDDDENNVIVVAPEDPAVVDDDENNVIVVAPEAPAVGVDDERTEIIVISEAPLVGEDELPRTSGSDMLLLALGTLLVGSGFLIRRKRRIKI